MVVGGPRSATTWVANLLTTDTTLCLHDPLLEHTAKQLDNMAFPGKTRVGIADTSAIVWPEWVAVHPSKKVVLYRDPDEINASLRQLGLPDMDRITHFRRLAMLKNIPLVPWQTVFTVAGAKELCERLGVPFCRYRFQELQKMNIQPEFAKLPVSREAVQALVRRVQEAAGS